MARKKKKAKNIYSKLSNYKNRRRKKKIEEEKKKSNKGAAMIECEYTLQNVLICEQNRNT